MLILTSATAKGSAATCSRNTFWKCVTAFSMYATHSLTKANGKKSDIRKANDKPTISIAVTDTTRLLNKP